MGHTIKVSYQTGIGVKVCATLKCVNAPRGDNKQIFQSGNYLFEKIDIKSCLSWDQLLKKINKVIERAQVFIAERKLMKDTRPKNFEIKI